MFPVAYDEILGHHWPLSFSLILHLVCKQILLTLSSDSICDPIISPLYLIQPRVISHLQYCIPSTVISLLFLLPLYPPCRLLLGYSPSTSLTVKISVFYSFAQDLSMSSHFAQGKSQSSYNGLKGLIWSDSPIYLLTLCLTTILPPSPRHLDCIGLLASSWIGQTNSYLRTFVPSARNTLPPDIHVVHILTFIQAFDQMSSSQ